MCSKLNHYIPDFLGVELKDTKTDLELEGELSGSIAFERTFEWDVDGKSPTVRDVLIFTGIAGSTYVKMKTDIQNGEKEFETAHESQIGINDESGKSKRVIVELLPAFTINFGNEPVFKRSKWEKLML